MLNVELGNYNYCLTFCIQGWKSVIVIYFVISYFLNPHVSFESSVVCEINLNSVCK